MNSLFGTFLLLRMKHSYSSISKFYIFSGAFEAAAEALAVGAAEAWAGVEIAEFEFNTSFE